MEWKYESWRDTYDFPYCEKSIEWLEKKDKDGPGNIHLHHNIELIYIIEGSMRLQLYEDDRMIHGVRLVKNDVIMINCNILHTTVTLDRVRYYLALIPPNTLTTPLHIGVGKTFPKPYNDEDQRILQMLDDFSRFSKSNSERYKSVICTSIANTVTAYLLPRLGNEMIELHGGSMKSDIIAYVYKNYRNPELSAESLAKNFGYSKRYLSSLFSEKVGMGIRSYITALRLSDAKNLLETTPMSIESIAYTVGFESERTFFRVFRDATGKTPGEYRHNDAAKV